MKLTRDLFIPLIDENKLKGNSGGTYKWLRIDKSTVFALAFNPQEETYGYIDTPNDTTEITSYQPELPQEITLDKDNPLFAAMFDFCMKMPVGSDAVVPFLLVAPAADTGKPTAGYLWAEASISPGELNTVDGKLSFTVKLNGKKQDGTVSASDGAYTFAPAE